MSNPKLARVKKIRAEINDMETKKEFKESIK
jgi:hypothetical protein